MYLKRLKMPILSQKLKNKLNKLCCSCVKCKLKNNGARRKGDMFQMCLKLWLVLILTMTSPTSSSSGHRGSGHLSGHTHSSHTTRPLTIPLIQHELLPSSTLDGDNILAENVPPTSSTNYSLSSAKQVPEVVVTNTTSSSFQSSSKPKYIQNNKSKSKKNVQKSTLKTRKTETKEEADDSVPVVPIQLPPPNATLQYHYTDDPSSSMRHLLKTDFSRIILPFKTTPKDVRNPDHYRDYHHDHQVFFQDFTDEELNRDDDFVDDFNLYTKLGGDDEQEDQTAVGTEVQRFQQNFEQDFNSEMDKFLRQHELNVSSSSSPLESHNHKEKKKTHKKKMIKPQRYNVAEFGEEENRHLKPANFFIDHDYPEISHDFSGSRFRSGSGSGKNKELSKKERTQNQQHNDYYELYNNNKNKNKTAGGKSDSLLKSEDKENYKHYFSNSKDDNDGGGDDELQEEDEDEVGEDLERFFESKKIAKKNKKKFIIPSSSNSSSSFGGTSLEDVSLSLNFDNGGSSRTGEKAGTTSTSGRSLMRRRPRRSVVHLYDMVVCATGCNPLAYKGYGCYCGFLGSGLTVDGIDRCCAKHDWCYHHAKCPPFLTYFVPYYWTCNDGRPRCVTEYRGWKGVCGANLCECDRQFAECLRKFPCPRSRAMCMTSPWRNLPIGPNFVFLA